MEVMRSAARVQAHHRPEGYYEQSRPDVAALVPQRCHRVLEVGCGTGTTGALLCSRGHHVTGLELNADAAERASQVLDVVVTGDVEQGLPFVEGSFDAVIFADVLEHLVDPWRVLREAVELLAEGGVVLASIPNVQNIDVVRRLMRGRWDYRERGILDHGHLRFFTLSSIRSLFAQAELRITRVERRYRRTWLRSLLTAITAGYARSFLTRNYLVVAERVPVGCPTLRPVIAPKPINQGRG